MDLDALVKAYREDQPAARHQLPARLYRLILPIFRRRFEQADVEDLVQETLAVVFENLDDFEDRGRGSFRAWVVRIAQNRKLGRAARLSREVSEAGPVDVDQVESADAKLGSWLHWRERLTLLSDALLDVDPVYREALLHLGEGGNASELAERAGVETQTIYSRVHRGRKAAREQVRARRKTTGPLIEVPS